MWNKKINSEGLPDRRWTNLIPRVSAGGLLPTRPTSHEADSEFIPTKPTLKFIPTRPTLKFIPTRPTLKKLKAQVIVIVGNYQVRDNYRTFEDAKRPKMTRM